jgi:hypothetical protein
MTKRLIVGDAGLFRKRQRPSPRSGLARAARSEDRLSRLFADAVPLPAAPARRAGGDLQATRAAAS